MIDQFPRDPFDVNIGTIRFSGAEHLRAAVSNDVARAQQVEAQERRLSTSEAIAKCRELKLTGFAAVGKFCSLTGDGVVDGEQSLRLSDAQTMREARGSFHLKDATFFAPARPSVVDFTPEQRRRIAMRTSVGRSDLYDADGRGTVTRR